MKRYIEINNCRDCPHRDHRGGYGKVMYIPVCRKIDKTIEYATELRTRTSGRGQVFVNVVAIQSVDIPEWCPLPKLEEGNTNG